MREIINPWTGLEAYNCFGCSPNNPLGAHMRFYDEDSANENADVVSVWEPTQNHQSWINTLHGGMQATLLDEVCGWVVFAKLRTSGVTAKMDIKYKKPVSTVLGPVVLRARLMSNRHHIATVVGEIWSGDELCASCECTYFAYGADKAAEMGYCLPTLGDEDLTLSEIISQKKYISYRTKNLL